jgi:hypothetical protein
MKSSTPKGSPYPDSLAPQGAAQPKSRVLQSPIDVRRLRSWLGVLAVPFMCGEPDETSE